MTTNKNAIMQCGCSAQSTIDDEWICSIHDTAQGAVRMEPQPDLSERVASCKDCGKVTRSAPTLAFFRYRKGQACDDYYCGCWGWD